MRPGADLVAFTWYRRDPANPNSLSDNWVWALRESADGLLWIGTNDGGLNCFDPRTERFVHYLHDPRDSTSLSNNTIRAIYEDPRQAGHILWIGTENGLNKFDRETGKFIRYYEKHGLPNGFIYGILGDDAGLPAPASRDSQAGSQAGNLWISSNRGLSKFNLQTATFRNYGPEDGLQSYEFNTGTYFKNERGEMFFGGINGLNVFHPDSVQDNPHLPAVVLTGFKKFDRPADLGQNPAAVEEIRLRYSESVFSFQFAALEYTHPAKNRYAYKMEGFEKEWIYCGARREVRYTHLDPGAYTFRVKASNNDGVWNEAGLAIRVIISPPFWAAWWFRALAALAILGALGGSIRYLELRKVRRKIAQLERERELERERARISRDMHDEVGASLSRISILSNLAQSGALPPEEVQNSLAQISRTAAEVVDEMSEIIWALNPKNDALDNLAAYLRQYASQYFQPAAVRCRFQFPEMIPALKLSAEARRNLFLAVKEALHNVQKHSGASEVRLGLAIKGGQLEIEIQDNGKGFCPESLNRPGNGLVNMRKRMEEIEGTFTLESREGGGTLITIRLDLEKCAKQWDWDRSIALESRPQRF